MSAAPLLERRRRAVPRGVASATPVFAARAANAEVWDTEGRRYIDFAGGIAVLNTGHGHPKVTAALAEQAARFTHTAFQVMAYESYVSLAERLNALAPIRDARTIFLTTGAEAVENAVKIARAKTGRSGVVAFAGGFHGRSLLTLGLTGKVFPYKDGFGPFPGDIFHVPFPAPSRGVSVADSLAALDALFRTDIAPGRIAAMVVEPVQGEGGFHVAPDGFLAVLRDTCDRHGILLICDEVQTGFARTGKMFATEHFGVEPDLIAVAKALGGGVPLSAVIGKAEVMDAPGPGGLGGTFGGSPLGCAAAHAVLDVIEGEDLCARADVIGARMKDALRRLPITDIRGLGAMVAFDLPSAEVAGRVRAWALDEGLVVLACGLHGDAIRLLPPLTIPVEVLDEGLEVLARAVKESGV